MLVTAKDLYGKDVDKIRLVFTITEEDLQIQAQRQLGRKLTGDELYSASKSAEEGLSIGLNVILETAVSDSIIKK